MIPTKDHYSILECERFADRETVRKNFYRLMLVHHPDKSTEQSPQAQAMVEAWAVLSDATKKQTYDTRLRQTTQHQELLNYKFGWRVASDLGRVECPQCGESTPIPAEATVRLECDGCSAYIDLERPN